MKNVIKLQNNYLSWKLDKEIGLFDNYHDHERVHESLDKT